MAVIKPRNRVVLFRLTEEEYESLQEACSRGSARSFSDFARARILHPERDAARVIPGPSLQQVEAKLTELKRAVERLTAMLAGIPEGALQPGEEDTAANGAPERSEHAHA